MTYNIDQEYRFCTFGIGDYRYAIDIPAVREINCNLSVSIAIGVSTGGPRTLSQLLPRIPANYPVPIFLVLSQEGGGMKILTVDDMSTIRTVIVGIIETLGHEALEAVDGEHALEVVQENPDIDFVLLDREMPKLGGIEFLDAFKSDDANVDTPVVMVSSWADPQWIIQALEAGAIDFLPKPFSPELLATKIAHCCSG